MANNPFNKTTKKSNAKYKAKLKALKNEYKTLRTRVEDRFNRMLKADESIPGDKKHFSNLYEIKPEMESISVLNERVKSFNLSDEEYIAELKQSIKEAKAFLKNKNNSSKVIKAANKDNNVGMMNFVLGLTGKIITDPKILEQYGRAAGFVRELAADQQWKLYDMATISKFIDPKIISKITKSNDSDAKAALILELTDLADEYFK